MGFPASTKHQAWAQRLRLPWMGKKGRAMVLGYAKVLGDLTIDWMTAALLERLPEFASPTAVALHASERQLDVAPGEATAAVATRATQWINLGRFVGTPLGILLGLHFSGFDYGVLVQQNGVAYQLQLPLPPIISGQPWDPRPNLIVTPTAALDVALHSTVSTWRSIPAGNSWWTIDSDTDFCSRYQLLFPGPQFPTSFYTVGRAQFVGSSSAALTWSNTFPDTSYVMLPGQAVVTDGTPGPIISIDPSTKTQSGVTVTASGPFNGWVDVLAFQSGANPFADLHPVDLARMKATIRRWNAGKATCVGVYAAAQGKFAAWPVGTMAQMLGVPSSIVSFAGPWS